VCRTVYVLMQTQLRSISSGRGQGGETSEAYLAMSAVKGELSCTMYGSELSGQARMLNVQKLPTRLGATTLFAYVGDLSP